MSEYDPTDTSEGSLDPLGLYAISDALAVKLVPGVRQRQTNPRFLTATAVSLAVCSAFDEDVVASDGVTPPWMVFEWHMLEGLTRTAGNKEGLPGRQKVERAIKDKVPLSAPRYLKNARTLGFHGIYRILARTIEIESAGQLGECGHELLGIWEAEQGLKGFHTAGMGSGKSFRKMLTEAIEEGLEKGHVSRSSGWAGWDFFRRHLAIDMVGQGESQFLTTALTGTSTGHLREIWDFLLSTTGRALWEEPERAIHTELVKTCSDGLRDLIETIILYEKYARHLQDAFDDILYLMSTRTSVRTAASELVKIQSVKTASHEFHGLYTELLDRLAPYNESIRLREQFSRLSESTSTLEWTVALLEHHKETQSRKPPDGRAPWIEHFDDGSFIVRPLYRRDEGGTHDGEYVHMYRCRPLMNFARNLGRID